MADAASAVEHLLRVAELDTVHRHRYLRRADGLLGGALPPAEHAGLLRARSELEQLRAAAPRAAAAADWSALEQLARRAEALRSTLAQRRDLLDLRARLDRVPPVSVSPFSLALHGFTDGPLPDLQGLRDEMVRLLAALEEHDRGWGSFYAERRRWFARLRIVRDAGAEPSSALERAAVRQELDAALAMHDWQRVERMARTLGAASERGRVRGDCLGPSEAHRLADPLPVGATENAPRLRLVPVMVRQAEVLGAYVCCHCADRPELAAEEAPRCDASQHPCHPCPPGVDGALRETLDLLMLRAFVASSGVRYLPPFSRESMLVEPFPEDAPADASPLLEILRLPARCGRSRLEIEDALRRYEDDVLAELHCDSEELSLVCIPFDAYLRLAPEHGWGRREQWTHFDGYQILRGPRLRALAGGHVRYGGAADLVGIGLDYAPERLVARFAVVRRERLLVTATGDRLT